jgi:predicted RNA binding protein YcfA (HicA-like mRNA interferase family)
VREERRGLPVEGEKIGNLTVYTKVSCPPYTSVKDLVDRHKDAMEGSGGSETAINKLFILYLNRYIFIATNGNEIIKKPQAAGWKLDRINGSHHILMKGGKLVPVPRSRQSRPRPWLGGFIARQTGVKLK